MLERVGELLGSDLRQRLGVGAPWVRRVGGKKPALHRAKAGDRKTFGARQDKAGLGLAKAPAGSSSGIEQDGDDGEIDTGACRFGGIGAWRDEGGAVDPAY